MITAYKRLPDSELEVMSVIWQTDEPINSSTILGVLDPEKNKKIQTVQILLNRLLNKGYVKCEKDGRINYYTPLVTQEEYLSHETSAFVEKMYKNSPFDLLKMLFQNWSFSETELDELQEFFPNRKGFSIVNIAQSIPEQVFQIHSKEPQEAPQAEQAENLLPPAETAPEPSQAPVSGRKKQDLLPVAVLAGASVLLLAAYLHAVLRLRKYRRVQKDLLFASLKNEPLAALLVDEAVRQPSRRT